MAAAQESQNEANNPLTPKITINLQNYYIPELIGVPDADANQFLLRGYRPPQDAGRAPAVSL